jgi:hypothetical protein
MRVIVLKLAVASIAVALASCGSYHPGRYYAGLDYDAYYDDAYGPYYDGYWGDDGVFRYRMGPGRPFNPDSAGHFHHAAIAGTHGVHSSGGRR